MGSASIQVARALGARSIAVVSSDAKERLARDLGADEVVRSTGKWLEEVRELTGGGADVVIDPVGGDRFTDSVRALAIGGRLVVVGFAAGSIPSVQVNRLLLRNAVVLGIAMDGYERAFPGTVAQVSAAVSELAERGTIDPVVGTRVPLEEGAEALRMVERREALGKVVVDVC